MRGIVIETKIGPEYPNTENTLKTRICTYGKKDLCSFVHPNMSVYLFGCSKGASDNRAESYYPIFRYSDFCCTTTMALSREIMKEIDRENKIQN